MDLCCYPETRNCCVLCNDKKGSQNIFQNTLGKHSRPLEPKNHFIYISLDQTFLYGPLKFHKIPLCDALPKQQTL